VDLNGLSGSSAGSDASVEASPDASTGSDAPGPETTPDASLEAPVEAPSNDAAPDGPFCATHPGHTLCADWDNGVLLQGFSALQVYGPEAGVNLADAHVSPPYSLHGGVGPRTSVVAAAAQLQYDLPSSITSARIELDLMVCDRSGFTGGTKADFFGINCQEPGNLFAEVAISINSLSDLVLLRSVIDGGLVTNDQILSSSMTTGSWHHVLLQPTYGNPGHIHVEVDGVVAIDRDETILCNGPVSNTFQLGPYSYDVGPRCDAYVDNLLVDVH
jgi:hypothetical protein